MFPYIVKGILIAWGIVILAALLASIDDTRVILGGLVVSITGGLFGYCFYTLRDVIE